MFSINFFTDDLRHFLQHYKFDTFFKSLKMRFFKCFLGNGNNYKPKKCQYSSVGSFGAKQNNPMADYWIRRAKGLLIAHVLKAVVDIHYLLDVYETQR